MAQGSPHPVSAKPPSQGSSSQFPFWFMRRGMSISLDPAEEQMYRDATDGLYSSIGSTRREHVSRKRVEVLVKARWSTF